MKKIFVNRENLKYNIEKIKQYAPILDNGQEYTIIGIVKGNGYGLDLVQYSKILIENGIKTLAVATIEEANELRKSGIKTDILMLSTVNHIDELEQLIENDIIITIGSKKSAELANEMAKKGNNIRAHLKIDTGFGRYGFIYNDFNTIIETIEGLEKRIKIEGIFSHFSMSYYKNNKWTKEQFDRFIEVLEMLKTNHIEINLKHICNSSGFINYPEMHLNAARIGSALLGRVSAEKDIGLKKIGEFKTTISEIKTVPKGFNISYVNAYKTKNKTKIAIIPFGYVEGYNIGPRNDMFRLIDKVRILYRDIKSLLKKEKLTVMINGKKYDIIGTLGMYHAVVDITDGDVQIDDLVEININPIYLDRQIRREYI